MNGTPKLRDFLKEKIGEYQDIVVDWIPGHNPEAWLFSGPEESDFVDKISLSNVNARELASLLAPRGFTLKRIPKPIPEPLRVTTFNGKQYRLFEPLVDFDEAIEAFAIPPERILRIESAEEDAFLHSWLDEGKHYWLDGSDGKEEGVWTWGADLVPFWTAQGGKVADSFSAWAEGEPNNNSPLGEENCVVFHSGGPGWGDRACAEQHQVVLESPVSKEQVSEQEPPPAHSQEL